MEEVQEENFYVVLGVSRTASQQEIRQAYRALALKHHPDKNPNDREESAKRFQAVAQAFETLGNPDKRAAYDAELDFGAQQFNNPRRRHSRDFSFGDAEELFRMFFGGSTSRGGLDPFFSSDFGSSSRGFFDDHDRMMSSFFNRNNSGMSSPFHDHNFGFGSGMMSMSSFSSSTSSNLGGTSTSIRTTTMIQNGQRVTRTEKTIRYPDGRVETSVSDDTMGNNPQKLENSDSSKKSSRSTTDEPQKLENSESKKKSRSEKSDDTDSKTTKKTSTSIFKRFGFT